MSACHQRIAIYVTDLNPSHGGIERVTYLLSRELATRGYELYALHVNNLPVDRSLYLHYKNMYQGDSSRLETIPGMIDFISNNHIEIFINQIFTCYSSVELQKEIKKHTSSILINVFHTTPLLLDSLKLFHQPFQIPHFLNRALFSIHKFFNLKPRYRKGNRLSYHLCDAFVMLSSLYFKEFARDNKIKNTSKMYAIANLFESIPFSTVSKEKIILVVARLSNQQKRIDRTLQFWKQFHHRGDGWKLMIVGDGTDKDLLSKMAIKLCLTDYYFKGHSENPMDYYRRAMIFMMTSDIEGFGMTLIEAMSAGCVPVAMNTYSALPDIISDKQNGMIVPKDDISGMVTASRYIIDHFDAMSIKARESIKRFSVKSTVDKWEELFNQLCV